MKKKNEKMRKKIIIYSILISFLVVTPVLALIYQQKITSKRNAFSIGKVESEIIEDFDKETNTKRNVSIKNTGNTPSYIRVAILYNFQDKEENIIDSIPKQNEDYTIKFSSSNDWLYKDGYYYYKYKVEENKMTTTLIEECKQIKEYTDKTFYVDIIVQSIQAEPTRAVKEAWNVEVENGTIIEI